MRRKSESAPAASHSFAVSGFSLVEVVMVTALLMIGSSIAIVQLKRSVSVVVSDRASNLVISQLRYARQIAVDQRRNVLVQFDSPSSIQITRQDAAGATTVMSTAVLPPGYSFGLPPGAADTPDGFGNALPVYFNTQNRGTFLADGTFVDAASILLNGSVFTIGSDSSTARAVTLAGASGRLKPYYLRGNAWFAR